MHIKISHPLVIRHARAEFLQKSGFFADRRSKLTLLLLFASICYLNPFLFAQFGQKEAFFAQVAVGGGYKTIFTVHNSSETTQSIDFTLTGSSGDNMLKSQIQLPAGGTKDVTIAGEGAAKVGWARLSSPGKFSATEVFQYADSGGSLISQVGVLPSALAGKFELFGNVNHSAGTDTGIALANPNAKVVNLQINRLDASGHSVASKSIQIRPGEHMARFLDEEPFFPGLDNYSGTLEVAADQPVVAVTLRLDGQQYATLPVVTYNLDLDTAINAFQTEITCKYVPVGHMTGGPSFEASIAVPLGKYLVIESVSGLGADNPYLGSVDDSIIETTHNGQKARHKLSSLANGTQSSRSPNLRIYASPGTTVWISQRYGNSVLSISGYWVEQ